MGHLLSPQAASAVYQSPSLEYAFRPSAALRRHYRLQARWHVYPAPELALATSRQVVPPAEQSQVDRQRQHQHLQPPRVFLPGAALAALSARRPRRPRS